ncbi:hypothetical protein KC571_04325, partial [candidate division WWE3 bacterium]|nr:hypothetical protein [candidate division WWE3 bacterium]
SSPASVLHGDWIIALGSTKTAVFKGKAHLPKSLIIKNDSVLMLGNNDDVDSLIDIDRENEKLFVQSGSGIIVKDGAKLYLGDR